MKIRSFNVIPHLPAQLKPLDEMSRNLWFSWHWSAVKLFIGLNPEQWEKSYQNPVWMLGTLHLSELERVGADPIFLKNLDGVYNRFKQYLARPTWFNQKYTQEGQVQVAYFSCEFGIEECLPIYSGGLGLLSGDHLKSSSDLGIPLVAVGLRYQQGYFRQTLSHDGWQQEHYPDNDWYNMPVSIVKGKNGKPLKIHVDLATDHIAVQIWRVDVGRTPLFLLDTNLPENPPHQRAVTDRLYGGDRDMRIRQEIVLGIGGVRALNAMGFAPTVFHMNEGHSAFLALERIRTLMTERKLTLDEAWEIVWASNVFTTHTPVPAGNERFDPGLVRHYFGRFADEIGLSWNDFAALGNDSPRPGGEFNMTILAIKMAAFCNGVAKLHGVVSRRMWNVLWPELPEAEVPISSITNGVHVRSWISHEMRELVETHLGGGFLEELNHQSEWDQILDIPDDDLWSVKERRRAKLVEFVRKRIKTQMTRRGSDMTELRRADQLLCPRTLTIGFARRFATYKRGDLIFREPDRLARILSDPERPVQIIFAGKAHPQDIPGKEFIKTISHFVRNDERFIGRIVFVDDYDILVARYLLQGVDVWLNNPRRPLEASGTSGMKAVVNGGLNLSFLDGWWDEAYTPECGWAVSEPEKYSDENEQDRVAAQALYNLLERDITHLFYDRDSHGLPRKWTAMMKNSMAKLGAVFNTHRMVSEYTERFYLPAHRAGSKLDSQAARNAKTLASWRKRVTAAWPDVSVSTDDGRFDREVKAGDRVPVTVTARLGTLGPSEVSVEIYHGEVDGRGEIIDGEIAAMNHAGTADADHLFKTEIVCRRSGRYGFAARILPRHPDMAHPFTPYLLKWE